jgi:hypothetical protein
MTVADVGAGFGPMTVVLDKSFASGHVFATDVGGRQLEVIREYVKREGLANVTVIESAHESTNLPVSCCDAAFVRLSTITSAPSIRSTGAWQLRSNPVAGWQSSTLSRYRDRSCRLACRRIAAAMASLLMS